MEQSTKKLFFALLITFLIFIVEFLGGLISKSLALLSDSGHVFTDSLAILLSLIASVLAKKPSTHKATFGYERVGILVALINGIILILIAVFIFIEGYKRFINPPTINIAVMLPVAFIGLLGNLAIIWILSYKHEDLNIKSAWLHVVGDTISSLGVIVAGLVIKFTGATIVDPIVSSFIGLIIVIGGFRVVRDALWVFLEFAPKGFDVKKIKEEILKTEGVIDVHDIHLWAISYRVPAFSAHIVIENRLLSEADKIRAEVEKKLKTLGIKHTVVQIEYLKCK
ncbi:MAG: cation diffusion facilitator family transporter [Thermodesulfovibrio sp.]|nr:cation diffusion facilitator family transporter [Thermodesulfovibrio sp.]